jgi:uncharacterized cupredoxin-like copper-binding protein
MRLHGIATLVLVSALVGAALIGACAGPAATPTPASATRIEVTLTDAMRIEPDPITVPAGVAVTYVVTNTGQIDHEFMLGDEAAQADHEMEMLEPGAMAHDHSYVILVKPGETRELVFTFGAPGQMLAGCHIPGHYPAGMKSTVAVR